MFAIEIYLYIAFDNFPSICKFESRFEKKEWLVTGDLVKQIDLTIFRE